MEIEGWGFISKSNSSLKNAMSLWPSSIATSVPIILTVPITNRDGPITGHVPITDRNAFWGHFSLKSLVKYVFTSIILITVKLSQYCSWNLLYMWSIWIPEKKSPKKGSPGKKSLEKWSSETKSPEKRSTGKKTAWKKIPGNKLPGKMVAGKKGSPKKGPRKKIPEKMVSGRKVPEKAFSVKGMTRKFTKGSWTNYYVKKGA